MAPACWAKATYRYAGTAMCRHGAAAPIGTTRPPVFPSRAARPERSPSGKVAATNRVPRTSGRRSRQRRTERLGHSRAFRGWCLGWLARSWHAAALPLPLFPWARSARRLAALEGIHSQRYWATTDKPMIIRHLLHESSSYETRMPQGISWDMISPPGECTVRRGIHSVALVVAFCRICRTSVTDVAWFMALAQPQNPASTETPISGTM